MSWCDSNSGSMPVDVEGVEPAFGAWRTNNVLKTVAEGVVLLASGSLTNVRVEVGAEDPVLEDEVIIYVFWSFCNLYVLGTLL
eukprot:Gb_10799 [translate_table: standard]